MGLGWIDYGEPAEKPDDYEDDWLEWDYDNEYDYEEDE